MPWFKKIEISEEDTRNYVDYAVPNLVKLVGEPIYITTGDNPSLVTREYLQKQVEQLLDTKSTTLDYTTISGELEVDKTALEPIITKCIANCGAYDDGIHILPRKYIENVSEELVNKIWQLSEICSRFGITIKAVEHVVKRGTGKLTLMGSYVVPNQVLDQHVVTFKNKLEKATVPVKYSDLEEDKVLLPLVKSRLHIVAHDTIYYPKQYVESKLSEVKELLQKSGYVKLTTVPDIIDPSKFSRSNDSLVLGPWIVLQSFICAKTAEIGKTLGGQMYYDLRDLPLGPYLADYILSQDSKLENLRNTKKYPQHFLVRPQLERQILDDVNKKVSLIAKKRAQEIQLQVNGATELKEWLDTVEPPNLVDIKSLILDTIPSEMKLADRILPLVRASFRTELSKHLEPIFVEAQEKLKSQIRVHLNGLLSLQKDSELYNMAWSEWQQYVSERQYQVPDSVEIACNQFNTEPLLLSETCKNLVAKSKLKLNKTKDTALILHLAATIYHSKHFCQDGLLKIRGKALPKLLKSFEFPQSFSELKNKLKTANPELINEVKSAVL